MATVLDIVRDISQAAANANDGSHDERFALDGEAKKVGLKREEGDALTDSRVIDGFGVNHQRKSTQYQLSKRHQAQRCIRWQY